MSPYRKYKIKIKDRTFVFRGLTQKEIRTAARKKGGDVDLYILRTCVEGDYNWDEEHAGVTNRLLTEIYRVSGLDEAGEPANEALEWIKSPGGRIEAIALAVIPGLTLDILDNCDPHDYARYIIATKFVLARLYGLMLEDVIDLQNQQEGVNPGALPVGPSRVAPGSLLSTAQGSARPAPPTPYPPSSSPPPPPQPPPIHSSPIPSQYPMPQGVFDQQEALLPQGVQRTENLVWGDRVGARQPGVRTETFTWTRKKRPGFRPK